MHKLFNPGKKIEGIKWGSESVKVCFSDYGIQLIISGISWVGKNYLSKMKINVLCISTSEQVSACLLLVEIMHLSKAPKCW